MADIAAINTLKDQIKAVKARPDADKLGILIGDMEAKLVKMESEGEVKKPPVSSTKLNLPRKATAPAKPATKKK